MEAQTITQNGELKPFNHNIDTTYQLFSRTPKKALSEMQEIVQVMSSKCQGEEFIAIINNKKYPKVEWWTTVAATLGLFPVVKYSRKLDRDDEIAYESRVEVKYGDIVVGAGEAMCSNKENRWNNADEYAIRSMSITRATGKCYRIPLSFLAVMAGLNPTPAEEIPLDNNIVEPIVKSNGGESATDKQLNTLTKLLDSPYLDNRERTELSKLLLHEISKKKASEIISYYYGVHVFRDGHWEKVKDGVLDSRKNDIPD